MVNRFKTFDLKKNYAMIRFASLVKSGIKWFENCTVGAPEIDKPKIDSVCLFLF
jgi:hypothetical protein